MLTTTAPSRHQLIISQLDGAKGNHTRTRCHTQNPQVGGSLENALSISGSNEDEFDVLMEESMNLCYLLDKLKNGLIL